MDLLERASLLEELDGVLAATAAGGRVVLLAGEAAFATGELQWTGQVAAARAEHAWLHGEERRVAEEAARVFDAAVQIAHPWFAGELAFWLWLAGAPQPLPPVVAEPYRLLLAGDWRGAAAAWRALGCPYQRALALACGDQDEAPLETLALLDGLGARQTAQRLRRQLRRRGNLRVPRGPNRATAANPAGLTGRQVEVLALLAEGLTDAEIAPRRPPDGSGSSPPKSREPGPQSWGGDPDSLASAAS